jgi:hypothetical protein
MARYGRDYGFRLVDRDVLRDTRWSLDRTAEPIRHTHRGPPRLPPVDLAPGYDFGLRGGPGEHRPTRQVPPPQGFRHPMEMPYDAGFRGRHPDRDRYGAGRQY